MEINREHLNCVAFLCVETKGKSGRKEIKPVATGFIVRIFDFGHPWDYLVTADHCIYEVPTDRIYIRVNTPTGVKDVLTQKDDWFHHDDFDVAAILFQEDANYFPIHVINLVSAEYHVPPPVNASAIVHQAAKNGAFKVKPGDELFFVGLFSESAGEKRNLPVARFGHVSRMPEEPIAFETKGRGTVELLVYLAELHSWGGHSGSPAFWYKAIYPGKLLEVAGEKHQVVESANYMIGCLGLITGHFDISAKAESNTLLEFTTKLNAGMAMITPAHAIKDLLMREDLREDRQDRIARDQNKPSGTFDSITEPEPAKSKPKKNRDIPIPPINRKKFFESLTKATQKRD